MTKPNDDQFKNVIAHAKEYGQSGADLKNNIKAYWWKKKGIMSGR